MDAITQPETSTSNSNPDVIQSNDSDQGFSTCSGSNGFRVRKVFEINDVEHSDVSSAVKRKLCTEDFLNENETSSSKKTKNLKGNPNEKDSTSSSGTGEELQQGDEENRESNPDIPNITVSDTKSHCLISSPEEIDTRQSKNDNIMVIRNTNVNIYEKEPACSTASNIECQGDIHESTNDNDPCSSSTGILVQVKAEPIDTNNSKVDVSTSTSKTVDIKPALNVKKEEASSTSRESCKYGIRCYRRNPMHRIEESHPGDHDYKRPNFPQPPVGTPDCPFGDACYRRNPAHFQQFTHPPETDFDDNWKNFKMRLRQRLQQNQNTNNNNDDGNDHDSDMDDYDLEDPFIDDEDLDQDYVPSDDDEGYDECDKAEE